MGSAPRRPMERSIWQPFVRSTKSMADQISSPECQPSTAVRFTVHSMPVANSPDACTRASLILCGHCLRLCATCKCCEHVRRRSRCVSQVLSTALRHRLRRHRGRPTAAAARSDAVKLFQTQCAHGGGAPRAHGGGVTNSSSRESDKHTERAVLACGTAGATATRQQAHQHDI